MGMGRMPQQVVTVFGGTGFLGRRVVERLLAHGYSVRIASRHPDRASDLSSKRARAEAVEADINDDRSTAAAVADVYGIVNAVSLYVEKGQDTFQSVHVEAAARLARHAREAGVDRLVQISGLGSDPNSPSPYIRSRGEGEEAVRAAFPNAILIRPAVMFGWDDAFLVPLSRLLRRFPVFGLFGRGLTKLQPVHVEDVAEGIVRAMKEPPRAIYYELGGPQIYTYRSLVEMISRSLGKRRLLVPVPFSLWHSLAYAGEMLPTPPITRNQIELMQNDNVAAHDVPGFPCLKIPPTPLEKVLPQVVQNAR